MIEMQSNHQNACLGFWYLNAKKQNLCWSCRGFNCSGSLYKKYYYQKSNIAVYLHHYGSQEIPCMKYIITGRSSGNEHNHTYFDKQHTYRKENWCCKHNYSASLSPFSHTNYVGQKAGTEMKIKLTTPPSTVDPSNCKQGQLHLFLFLIHAGINVCKPI